jgi:hypothetical protein
MRVKRIGRSSVAHRAEADLEKDIAKVLRLIAEAEGRKELLALAKLLAILQSNKQILSGEL